MAPTVLLKLYLEAGVPNVAAGETAAGPQLNVRRNQRNEPTVERPSVYVYVVTLVVAFQPLPNVNGPNDEHLRLD
jgi:hypothetical protein